MDQRQTTMILQELFGIEHPIIQAPMAGVQGSALAVAVSNAGGLGSLPCAMLGVDAIREELATIRTRSTRPVNVNFFCHRRPEPSAERERRWQEMPSRSVPVRRSQHADGHLCPGA